MNRGPESVTVFAPAKINLTLHVTGRRPDGYHELESLVAFADVGDEITITPAARFSFHADGPFSAGLPPPDDDLAVRAARLLAAHCGRPLDVALRLTKNLPLASGIGGGSADAAAVAIGLCDLWQIDMTAAASLPASLGADVAACMTRSPRWMAGVGERLTPAPPLPPAWLAIVNPLAACPTPAVYAALKGRFSMPQRRPPAFADFASLIDFLGRGGNDLAAPAREIVPAINEMLDRLARADGCALARLSGSGATGFGLFATQSAAREAARSIGSDHPEWWVRDAALRPFAE